MGRLEHIKSSLEENKKLYSSDMNYVEKMIEQHIGNQEGLEQVPEIKSEQVKNSIIDEPANIIQHSKKIGIFSRKKNYQCLDCEEKFVKWEDLHSHGQTIHNRIILNCSLCDATFLYPQSRISHTKYYHKVNVGWQIVFAFIPIASLWAFSRIDKFTKIIIFNLIAFALWFVPMIILSVISPDAFEQNFENQFYDIISGVVFVWFIFGIISIQLYFLIKWSRQWNKKIDVIVESISKEEPRQN